MRERGISKEASFFDIRFVKGVIVLVEGKPDHGVVGEKGLEDHFAGEIGAARSPRNLDEELKEVFGGPEIGDV